jgi:UDP-glucose 4-epimerase
VTVLAPVLVTGAHGRLGRAVLRVGAGAFPLVGLGSPRAGGAGRTLDITDAPAVLSAFDEIRPRVVIHLGSVVGAACAQDPVRAEAVNIAGTANVAAAALKHGVERIVFLSTAAVYGDFRRYPLSENDTIEPSGIYATSKLQAERVLAEVSESVAVDVLRVFNIYGPDMRDSLITRLLSRTGDPVTVNGLDRFVRDYIHSDDVARAVLAAAQDTSPGHRIMNVGSGIPRNNRDLLESLPAERLVPVTVGPEVESYSCANIFAISEALLWQPREPWPPLYISS